MAGHRTAHKHSGPPLQRDDLGHHDTPSPAAPTVLTVGAADHPAERAADDAAMSALSRLDRLCGRPPGRDAGTVRRSVAPSSDVEVGFDGGALEGGTDRRIRALQGRGRPLPDPIRREMETAFDTPLDRVRVHTGSEAATLNQAMSARAFTIGQDIFLGGNELTSDQAGDRHTLAHEIAHTLQSGADVHRLTDADPVIRRYTKRRAPDGGNHIGDASSCHCHIDIGSPHFKVGKDQRSRLNFGRDMSSKRIKEALDIVRAEHAGKPGYDDCVEYMEEQI